METLVWNRRTGNLVGGHQRIAILDELEKSQDYCLTLAVIDVDEKKERELNVFLNNVNAMGEWDTAALEKLVNELGGDISGLGFDPLDIQVLLDSPEFAGIFSDENDKAKGDIEQIEKMKEARQSFKDKSNAANDSEFYIVAVFQTREQVDVFLNHCKLPVDMRYVDGSRLANLLGCELPSPTKEAN